MICVLVLTVNGDWSLWSEWGSCSVTCDVGIQRRDRSCSDPYPDKYGDHCFGESRDDRICMTTPCASMCFSITLLITVCNVIVQIMTVVDLLAI